MEKKLILLETIQTLCHVGTKNIFLERSIHQPLTSTFSFDNPGNPVVPNVDNPEPVTLYHGASNKLRAAIATSIRILMNKHHFPLPQNWTYEQLADESYALI